MAGPCVALLGFAGGFTYISGAFGACAAGVALPGCRGALLFRHERRRLIRSANLVTAASAIATMAHSTFRV